jgi:F-type H+-transporting ATPase subunit delta
MPDLVHLTVARRYASALLALAKERGRLDEVAADLAELKRVVDADPSVLRKLADPNLRGVEKAKLVETRLAGGRDPLVKNLLGLLVRRRREAILGDLFFAFGEELEKAAGILRVGVETASDPGAAFLADLQAKLAAATSKTVALESRVRPELLGGVRLVLESKLIDASVASKLARLKKRLLTARD